MRQPPHGADIGARGVDATVNLGDSVAGPLWPSETAESLVGLAFPTVCGNPAILILRFVGRDTGLSERRASGRGGLAVTAEWAAALQRQG